MKKYEKETFNAEIRKNNITYKCKITIFYWIREIAATHYDPGELFCTLDKISDFEVLEIEYPDGEMPDGEEFEQKKSEITEEDIIEYLESECGIEY